MPPKLTISTNSRVLIDQIVCVELINRSRPAVGLAFARSSGEERLLEDPEFIVPYLNSRLAAQKSDLRVEPLESYWFASGPNLGSGCYLALVETNGTKKPFFFGCHNPAISWDRLRKGEDLEAHRRIYFANIQARQLREQAEELVRELARSTGKRIQHRLAETIPTDEQALLLQNILPYDKDLTAWANVCLIMGWDFEEMLRQK